MPRIDQNPDREGGVISKHCERGAIWVPRVPFAENLIGPVLKVI
jgi:hypothetical protein